jgi:hypothetical protein
MDYHSAIKKYTISCHFRKIDGTGAWHAKQNKLNTGQALVLMPVILTIQEAEIR